MPAERACCFCTVGLSKKKIKKRSKEEQWGSCLSLTERIYIVCVRHSLCMADVVMKSLQIFCFEGPGLHLEYRRPYSTPQSREVDLREVGMKCRCRLLLKFGF